MFFISGLAGCRPVKRFSYRWFVKTHTLLALAYLALAYHSLIRTRFSYWAQPIGWVEAALLLAGSVAALMVLAGRVGKKRQAQAEVLAADWQPPRQTLRLRLAVPQGWAGHAPGQFAFITFSRAEGAHPYTIASAWHDGQRELVFMIKALGDYTSRLHEWLRPGQRATVEGCAALYWAGICFETGFERVDGRERMRAGVPAGLARRPCVLLFFRERIWHP